jgi:hypothetical protein
MNHPAELISSPAAMGGDDEEKRMQMEWNGNGMKRGERLCFEDTQDNKRGDGRCSCFSGSLSFFSFFFA